MEMLHLRYFVAVAEERSFIRASRRLHIAAPPLSQRIKALERELGTTLFIRRHHHIDLTPEARVLLPAAKRLVEQFDAVRNIVGGNAASPPRKFVIGVASEVPPELRTSLLAAIKAGHPELTVRLRPNNTGRLLMALANERIDLALVHGAVTAPGFAHVLLDSSPVCVVVSQGLGFDERTSVRLEELSDLPYLTFERDANPETLRSLDRKLNSCGVRQRIPATSNLAGMSQLVSAGDAFMIVSMREGTFTNKLFAGEPVVKLEIDNAGLSLDTSAVWRADRAASIQDVTDVAATVEAFAARAGTARPEQKHAKVHGQSIVDQ